MDFESLFVKPGGRTPRHEFIPALLTLLAAVWLFGWLVGGRTGLWSLLVLVYPGFVLHARRLRDMGQSVWVLALPVLLLLAAFAVWLRLASFGQTLDAALPSAALVLTGAITLWCCLGRPPQAAVPPVPGSP
jgi:uncharacterized membrane protein YhaH (DUF805 family)